MFKYLWFIILVIPVICFICYTVNAIRESLKDAIDYAEKVHDSSKGIKWILRETWSNFKYAHENLYLLWITLLILGIVGLFVTSLIVYSSTVE